MGRHPLASEDICTEVCRFLDPDDLVLIELVSKVWRNTVVKSWRYHIEHSYLSFRHRKDFRSEKHLVRAVWKQMKSHECRFLLVGGTFSSCVYAPSIFTSSIPLTTRQYSYEKVIVNSLKSFSLSSPYVGGSACTVDSRGRGLIMGGWDDHAFAVIKNIFSFDVRKPELGCSIVDGVSFDWCYAAATTSKQGNVYVMGGCNWPFQGEATVTSESYYYKEDVRLPRVSICPMQATRCGHSAVTLFDDSIVSIGGYEGGSSYLASAERFDAERNQWMPLPQMIYARTGFACALGECGSIYAAGGSSNGALPHNSFERYDVREKRWHIMPSMKRGRAYVSSCLGHRGLFFVAGGLNEDGTPIVSMECFDPVANKWNEFMSDDTDNSRSVFARASASMFYIW